MDDKCQFCESDDQCGCLALLDSLLPALAAAEARIRSSGDLALEWYEEFEDEVVSGAESIVRERVKRYGPVKR